MLNISTKTIREIALELPISTKVFEEFKIDYCCGGHKPFREACENAGVNPEVVLTNIENVIESIKSVEFDWLNNSTLCELLDYIVEKHHTYTREELINLNSLMSKVANRHGEKHFELYALEKLFYELNDDLIPHMVKEEQVLFPYIEKLEKSDINSTSVPFSCFGTVNNPIKMMMLEHDTAGDLLRKMREITKDYNLPQDACPSFMALYNRLQALELDLHQHIHLENNILFPKAIKLEETIYIAK